MSILETASKKVRTTLSVFTNKHDIERRTKIERRLSSFNETREKVWNINNIWFTKTNIFKHLEDVNSPVMQFLEEKDIKVITELRDFILYNNSHYIVSDDGYLQILIAYERYWSIMTILETLLTNAYEDKLSRVDEDLSIAVLMKLLDGEKLTFEERQHVILPLL